MKRTTVILFSLVAVLLLAGLCSCKQEAAQETLKLNAGVSGVTIPKWEISDEGLKNLPDAVTSGTGTGVSSALVSGLKNPPSFDEANHLIVMVCEGLTPELIKDSISRYGELILSSLPVKGTTKSNFTSSAGKLLVDYIIKSLYKNATGIVSWGKTSTNSLRRMTTNDDNTATAKEVNSHQFKINPPLVYVMGKGDFNENFSPGSAEYKNEVYKASGLKVSTLAEAIPYYQNDNVHFEDGGDQHDGPVKKLYTIFEKDSTLPSFRQETAFSLAWMQDVQDQDGFSLLMSYSPSSALTAADVQEFDEAVAVAVKFVLENPDSALLICGCPTDGSEESVCFYGLGKDVSVKNTLYECVSSLY